LTTSAGPSGRKLKKAEVANISAYVASLRMGDKPARLAARSAGGASELVTFQKFSDAVFDAVVPPTQS